MTLPRAVQKQQELAEELQKSLYETQETPAGALEEEDKAEVKQTEATTEKPQPAPEPSIEDDGHADPVEESIDELYRKLQAAHQTLQGKYRAEVPRLQQQVNTLNAQLNDAKRLQATAEKSAETAKAQLSDEVSRLREEIGSDATDALDSYAQKLVQSKLDSYQEGESEKTTNRFWNSLYSRVPDFDQVNKSPEFVKWLQNTDLDTGLTYQDTLNKAGETLDVITVIDLTKQFKRENQQREAPRKNPIEDHVSPKNRQTVTQAREKPTYTPVDYVNLQEQIRKGEWRGREAEARELEKEIHEALTG